MDEADIQNEVRFIGMDNTIEIWSRKAAEALQNGGDALGDALESMMNGTNNQQD